MLTTLSKSTLVGSAVVVVARGIRGGTRGSLGGLGVTSVQLPSVLLPSKKVASTGAGVVGGWQRTFRFYKDNQHMYFLLLVFACFFGYRVCTYTM